MLVVSQYHIFESYKTNIYRALPILLYTTFKKRWIYCRYRRKVKRKHRRPSFFSYSPSSSYRRQCRTRTRRRRRRRKRMRSNSIARPSITLIGTAAGPFPPRLVWLRRVSYNVKSFKQRSISEGLSRDLQQLWLEQQQDHSHQGEFDYAECHTTWSLF